MLLSTCSKLPIETASPTTPSPPDALRSLSGDDVSPSVVLVSGHINVKLASTAIDAIQATSFTATGY